METERLYSLRKEVSCGGDKKSRNQTVRKIVGLRYFWRCIITGKAVCVEIAHLLSYPSTKSNELLDYIHGKAAFYKTVLDFQCIKI